MEKVFFCFLVHLCNVAFECLLKRCLREPQATWMCSANNGEALVVAEAFLVAEALVVAEALEATAYIAFENVLKRCLRVPQATWMCSSSVG